MKIEGEKIYLAPFTKEYAADWVRWTQDEDVIRYSVMRTFTMEEEMEYLDQLEKNPDADMPLSIFLKENDKIIGNCGIHKKDKRIPDGISVGIVIGEKDEWGKGYGSDAIKALLKHIKENMDTNEVYLSVDIPNVAAIKCYKKCGFKIIRKEKSPERTNSGGEHYIMKTEL